MEVVAGIVVAITVVAGTATEVDAASGIMAADDPSVGAGAVMYTGGATV